MGIEDHKLKVFCTVAEVKRFAKAAEIIHLSQPAVTSQIHALEEMYETKLFERSPSNVSLTPTGEILYKYAKDILSMYAEAEKEIERLTGLIKGGISIGANSTIGNYILPNIIADFTKVYPNIKINLFVGNKKKIVDLLNSANIQVGLAGSPVKSRRIVGEEILEDELCAIAPPSHPFSEREKVSLAELIEEPFIFGEDKTCSRECIVKFFNSHGVDFDKIKTPRLMESIEAIKAAVERGLGISIVSGASITKELKLGTLKKIKIKEGIITQDISLLYKKNRDHPLPVEEFILFIKSYPIRETM